MISLVAILSAYLIRAIDIDSHKNTTNDGVKITNIGKLAEGIEGFIAEEGRLPTGTADVVLPNYVHWISPDYVYNLVPPNFTLYIVSSSDLNYSVTYFSPTGHILLCADPSDPLDEISITADCSPL